MDQKKISMDRMQESSLSFEPITDGLGFHPFSDGLPYAPIGKKPKTHSTGTGAVAAGRPTPVMPARQLAGGGQPRAVRGNHSPLAHFGPEISVPVVKQEQASATLNLKPTPVVGEDLGLGYLMKRLLAYVFDLSFNSLVLGTILIGVVWFGEMDVEEWASAHEGGLILSFFLLTGWFFIGFQEVLFKSSLGKFLFQMKLNGTSARIFFRALVFLPSLLLFGLGILWSALNSSRSGWHDILSRVLGEWKNETALLKNSSCP
ncbi:MAG: RDD family protein [Bdellovibrionia bacterium]